MKIGKMYFRDAFGYPVETYKGFYPLTNFIRLVLHTSPSKTWKHRNDPNPTPVVACDCCQAKESK